MSSATLFLKNKYLLVLSVFVILVAGLSALVSMPRLEDPRIVNRNPLIVTLVPGASAERVEAQVTEKLEEELQEVPEIQEMRSTSRAGVSIIAVELADGVYESERVFSLIRDKIAEAEPELPHEASIPFLDDQRGPVAYSLIVGVIWGHTSEPKLGILNRLAEDLADRLRTVADTQVVRLFGAPHEEITVTVDPKELAALGMTPSDLAASIRAADSKIPAGMLRSSSDDLILEVTGELDSLARIGSIPLRGGPDGTLLRVSDIARAERDWQSPPREIGLADGRRAVYVGAKVQAHRRADEWAEEALEVVGAFAAGVGGGVEVEVVFDQTRYTNERLADLGRNLLAGALVVIVVVFFAMGWRSSIVVASALPLTAAFALFGTALAGGALHQISIFGMVVALGLLIDNAIVVVDEVRKRLERKDLPAEAVSAAVQHLFTPLAASTLTTVFAFAPIVLVPGSVGDFVRSIGGSVILALIASFVLAMTIVPALAGWLAEAWPESGKRSWWRMGIGNERLTRLTRRGLVRGLRVPIVMLALASLLPLGGFVAFRSLGSQFFPPVDRDMFDLKLWLPPQVAIERTRAEVEAIEAVLRQDPAIRRVDWLIGGSFPSVYYNAVMNQDNARHHAQAVVTANSSEEVKRLLPVIQRRLDEAFPGAQIVVSQFAQGPPVEADVEFRLYGPSIEILQDLGDELRLRLAEHPGVLHTQATMGRGEPKLWLDANEEEARLAGLTLADVASPLQGSLEGTLGGSVIEDLEELDIRIRFENEHRNELFDIRSTQLTAAGRPGWTPLSVLGELVLRPEVSAITRHDGLRANLIHGYTRNGALAIDVTGEVLARLVEAGFSLPSGYRLELGGDAEDQNEAVGSLMIYLPVLLTLMVSTVILSFRSVRLAGMLGVVAVQSIGLGLLATWAYGFPVSFTTILGTLGLIGVALNDSIVVLAAIRSNPAARQGEAEAMADEVLGTLRHVISTTLTTVGGFLPLLIFVVGDFWPPLAIVLAGGVSGATILAAVFVPAAYRLVMTDEGRLPLAHRPEPPRVSLFREESRVMRDRRRSMRPMFLALSLLPVAAGCSVGPEIVAPDVAMASTWIEPTASSSSAPLVIEWWKTFADSTLVSYVERAVAHNHDIRIAASRVREARALRRAAAGGLYPDIAVGGGAARLRASENGFGPVPALVREGVGSLEDNVFHSNLDASWEIDVFGATRSLVDAASARVGAAIENRRDVQLIVVSEVALSYIELRGAQQRLAVAEDNVRIQAETLKFVEAQRTAGFASALQVSQARSQLEITKSTLPPLRAEIRRNAYRLAVLTGRLAADVLDELLEPGPLPAFPTEVALGHAPELLLRRPDLRRAERDLTAARLDIGVATAELYPRFFVRGVVGLESTSSSDLLGLSSGTGLLGAFFRWPIFRRGEIRAQIDAATAGADVALAHYEQAVLTALEDVERSLVHYVEEKRELEQIAEAQASARRAAELARQLYRLGLADFLTVLDAERSLREVDDRVTRSETEVRTRLIRLYKSLGGGWEALETRVVAVAHWDKS